MQIRRWIQAPLRPRPGSLKDAIIRPFKVRVFTLGTTSRRCETLSVFEDKPAIKTTEREYLQAFLLRCYGACHVIEMFINQFLPDAHGLGELSCIHLPLAQEGNHTAPDGLVG